CPVVWSADFPTVVPGRAWSAGFDPLAAAIPIAIDQARMSAVTSESAGKPSLRLGIIRSSPCQCRRITGRIAEPKLNGARGVPQLFDVMTTFAILPDRLAILRFVTVVVAAEAAGRVNMADVVRVGAETDLHLREDVAAVNDRRAA